MINKGLFTSFKPTWRTPKALYEQLDNEFHFDCDPCLVTEGTIHDRDMLGSTWGGGQLCKPAVWPRTSEMDKERIRRKP